jgi:AcrR family transcriptional regulator
MPKIVNHDQYRKELLSESFSLFSRQGYSTITMRQLATGLGVSTGTLYHYFENKQAIFEQMMLERVDSSIRTIGSELINLPNLKSKINSVFQQFHENEQEAIDEIIVCIDFYQHQHRKSQASGIIQQAYRRIKQESLHIFGIQDETLLQFLFSTIDGLLLSHIYGQEVDWIAQGEMISIMVENYLKQSEDSQ